MIKVHYSHPPRQWDFYAGYLLRLAILLSPLFLLFLTWYDTVPLLPNLLCLALLGIFRFLQIRRQSYEHYVLDYDRYLDKSEDISHEIPYPPDNVETGIAQLEALGFSRLGEESSLIGLNSEGIICWYMQNESDDVIAEIIHMEGIDPYLSRFSSWFAGHQLIETYYPVGDSLKYEDYRCEGINTSIEAAFHYHMRQVAEFESRFGAPLKQSSIEEINILDRINKEKYAPRLFNKTRIRVFAQTISQFMLFSAAFYWFVGYILAVKNASFSLAPANFDRSLTMIYGGIALAITGFIRMPGRSISQAKKKAS